MTCTFRPRPDQTKPIAGGEERIGWIPALLDVV